MPARTNKFVRGTPAARSRPSAEVDGIGHGPPYNSEVHSESVILIDELGVYVMNRVKELTKGAQHPTLQKGDVPSFSMALAR